MYIKISSKISIINKNTQLKVHHCGITLWPYKICFFVGSLPSLHVYQSLPALPPLGLMCQSREGSSRGTHFNFSSFQLSLAFQTTTVTGWPWTWGRPFCHGLCWWCGTVILVFRVSESAVNLNSWLSEECEDDPVCWQVFGFLPPVSEDAWFWSPCSLLCSVSPFVLLPWRRSSPV